MRSFGFTGLSATVVALALVPLALEATAQDPGQPSKPEYKVVYSGISLFRTYCSTCHGREAKGDGPMAGQLRYRPPDLTLLAKRNGGKYAGDDVYRMIDGRRPLKGHGGVDMPVWGDAFKNSREGYDDESVKARIDAIVDYLAGVQEHTPAPSK